MKRDAVTISVALLARIKCHTFKNPVSRSVLAREFGLDEREVSSIVSKLHDAGEKVAWSRGGFDRFLNYDLQPGYFYARRPEEMASTAAVYDKMALRYLSLKKSLMDFGDTSSLWEQSAERGA